MRLKHEIDLGYCTNIHRGETWEETFSGLKIHTNAVRERVSPHEPYGIGLRLSALAADELRSDEKQRTEFRHWLDKTHSYVFTINGFPYGAFHGTRVKENVYSPDWSTKERLDYTNLLFDLACEFAPDGQSVSVSTLPGSFKEFILPKTHDEQHFAICYNLRQCGLHIEKLREKTGRDIHLGLEPEPLGLFETSGETVEFFERLLGDLDDDEQATVLECIGVNYDTCHLAIEFEEPEDAIGRIREAGIRISKIHLSSALKLKPDAASIARLGDFVDEVYLHQVVVQEAGKVVHRFRDLPDAFAWVESSPDSLGDEWRVHFHVPVHTQPEAIFQDTRDHVSGTLGLLGKDPGWCQHFEMETYTWEVMPEAMRSGNVVDQLVAEYEWCLAEFQKYGLKEG